MAHCYYFTDVLAGTLGNSGLSMYFTPKNGCREKEEPSRGEKGPPWLTEVAECRACKPRILTSALDFCNFMHKLVMGQQTVSETWHTLI